VGSNLSFVLKCDWTTWLTVVAVAAIVDEAMVVEGRWLERACGCVGRIT